MPNNEAKRGKNNNNNNNQVLWFHLHMISRLDQEKPDRLTETRCVLGKVLKMCKWLNRNRTIKMF